jgi:hypothetical protein
VTQATEQVTTFKVGDEVYPSDKARNFDIGTVQEVGPQEAYEGGWFDRNGNRVSDDEVKHSSQWSDWKWHNPQTKLAADEVTVLWGGCGCDGDGPRLEKVAELAHATDEIYDAWYDQSQVPEGHFA